MVVMKNPHTKRKQTWRAANCIAAKPKESRRRPSGVEVTIRLRGRSPALCLSGGSIFSGDYNAKSVRRIVSALSLNCNFSLINRSGIMRKDRPETRQLLLKQMVVLPGGEWVPQ